MCKESLLIESVEQVQHALVNENAGLCVNRIPVLKKAVELVNLPENDLVNYFGILTVGAGTSIKLFFDGIELIKVAENSQIIELFDKIECYDNDGNANSSPNVFLRGYALTQTVN